MRPARAALAATLIFGAAACAPLEPQVADRSICVGLFQQYDRWAQFRPAEIYDRRRDRYLVPPELARLATQLRQNDCVTRARDLAGLDAAAAARDGRPIVESGAPLGRLVAVHVGALAGEAEAARAIAYFEGLGLRARGIGDRQLGRRVYVGPVTTEGALGEVLAAAFEAGFVAPYPSEFFRF